MPKPILRSPKDQGNQPNKPSKPHPNRDVRLQDLLDLEARLPSKEDLAKIKVEVDTSNLPTKADLEKSTIAVKTYITQLESRIPNKRDAVTKDDLLATEKRLSKLITQPRFDWTIGPVTNKVQQEKEKTMIVKITNEQQITLTLNPKTDTGRPAKIDGKATWEKIDGESEVQVAEDGLSALLVSSDNPGTTQVLVKADADIGDGVEEISEIIELQVAGATAKNLGLVASAPEAKPVVEG